MKIVATGIIQSGKFQKLAFDPKLLSKMQKAGEVLKEKTPVVVTGVSYKPRYYRGQALDKQHIN